MNTESKHCRILGGKISISIIGGIFLCFGTLISFVAMIGVIKKIPPVFLLVIGMFMAGLIGGFGYIMLTRMPYETVSDDKGIEMSFLWRHERLSWDLVEWYKIVALIGSAGVSLWIVLKYRQPIEEKICYRTSVMLLQSIAPFEGFSSKHYTSIFDKFVPHKRIRKWRQVFQ